MKADTEKVEKGRLEEARQLFAFEGIYEGNRLTYWGRWLIGRVERLTAALEAEKSMKQIIINTVGELGAEVERLKEEIENIYKDKAGPDI